MEAVREVRVPQHYTNFFYPGLDSWKEIGTAVHRGPVVSRRNADPILHRGVIPKRGYVTQRSAVPLRQNQIFPRFRGWGRRHFFFSSPTPLPLPSRAFRACSHAANCAKTLLCIVQVNNINGLAKSSSEYRASLPDVVACAHSRDCAAWRCVGHYRGYAGSACPLALGAASFPLPH